MAHFQEMAHFQVSSSQSKSKLNTIIRRELYPRYSPVLSFLHDDKDDEDVFDLLYHALPCYFNGKFASLKDKTEPYTESLENRDALYIKVEMPGIGKEDVSIIVDKGVMSIDGDEKGDGDKKKTSYTLKTSFKPIRVYKVHEIKAVIKNGVLKVVVPKDGNKQEKNMGVFHVQVN